MSAAPHKKKNAWVPIVQLIIVGLSAVIVLIVYFAKDRAERPAFNTQRIQEISKEYDQRFGEEEQAANEWVETEDFRLRLRGAYNTYPQLNTDKLLFVASTREQGGHSVTVVKMPADTAQTWEERLNLLLTNAKDALNSESGFRIENEISSTTEPVSYTVTFAQQEGTFYGMAKIIPGTSHDLAVIGLTDAWDQSTGALLKLSKSFERLR